MQAALCFLCKNSTVIINQCPGHYTLSTFNNHKVFFSDLSKGVPGCLEHYKCVIRAGGLIFQELKANAHLNEQIRHENQDRKRCKLNVNLMSLSLET